MFFIAYFRLFVAGLCQLRHAVREGDGGKVRLLMVGVLYHLLLTIGYVGQAALLLALVIG